MGQNKGQHEEQFPIILNGKDSGRRNKRQGKYKKTSSNPNEEELHRFQRTVITAEDKPITPSQEKTVPENTQPAGAGVAIAETIENAGDFGFDDDIRAKYAESYIGEKEQEEARKRATKFENDIAAIIVEKQKNEGNVDYDKIALAYFEDLLDATPSEEEKAKIKIFYDHYVKKVNNKSEKKQAEPVKIELVKPNPVVTPETETAPIPKKEESEQGVPAIEISPVLKTKPKLEEPREGFRIIPPAEKGQDLKNEFEQKHPNVLKKKRFNDKGDELFVLEYKDGKAKCFFTKKGNVDPEKPASEISLTEMDAILKEYTYEKSGSIIEPETQAKTNYIENKQEKMIANLPEKIINVFLKNASKALESFNADLSGKNGGENFIDKYSNEDKQQLLKLLLKPVLQEFIESKRMVLAEEFGFSQDNENELLTYIFEASIK